MRKLTLEQFQQKLKIAHPKEELKVLNYDGDNFDCSVKCLTCDTIYIKKAGYFVDKRKKSICKVCFPTQLNTLKTDYIPPDGYSLIGQYTGMQNKTLIRHDKCGFIWNIKPNNLDNGKGCPKCNKRISKGEQKITQWLLKNNLNFIHQFAINIENHHLIIDFYIPSLDLYIEYNGEQHYNPIAFFGGKEKFNKQVELDNLKKDFLKDKLLIISYLDFQNIENILESSTTIPRWSRP